MPQSERHLAQGMSFYQEGRLEESRSCYTQVLESDAGNAQALHMLGVICIAMAQYPEAITFIQQSLLNEPDFSAEFNLGIAFRKDGQLDASISTYRHLLEGYPGDADIHYSLGNALLEQGSLGEAVASYRRTVAIAPEHADAHNGLGIALDDQGLSLEAIASYRAALLLQPDHAGAHNNLAGALQDQGRMAESTFEYKQSILYDSESPEARWGLTMSMLPAVCSREDALIDSRLAFSIALAELDTWLTPQQIGGSAIAGAKQPFYLAYQDENNLELLSRYGDLCVRVMQAWEDARNGKPLAVPRDGILRVGIASAHIYDHSVWNAITRSWLQYLDSNRFELSVFHVGRQHDAETEYAKTRARYFGAHQNLEGWVQTIRTEQPDVLIYPEIGMDALTLQLASLRLAPVQAVSWGHPETTGLPTMDYYLSAEDFETRGANENYRENLVLLPNLGCCYRSLPVTIKEPDMAQLGLDDSLPLLLCPGSPFKYGQEHDKIFPRIALAIGPCQFVFFTFSTPNLTERLKQRLEETFVDAGLAFEDYCKFIPWQKRDAFFGLMNHVDVFLDTVGFSGFNTAMQAMECALPIVAREGRFMRGNLASGILKRLDLPELVATTDEEYIAIAVRLVRDTEYRQAIRQRIAGSRHKLFDDMAPIRAMEDFLGRVKGVGPEI